MEHTEIPEGWTVTAEEYESPAEIQSTDTRPAVWVEVSGPNNQLSPAERLSIATRLARQAAEDWGSEKGIPGEPKLSGASTDSGWELKNRFVQGTIHRFS